MITTLLSLYATGTLIFSDLAAIPHVMSWNNQSALQSTFIPRKDPTRVAPVIKAKAAIAVDLNNGLILYEKNIYTPLPIASLTKLMTVLIILEENNLKEIVTVSKQAAQTEGSTIWLVPNEKMTIENLLYATLINSANDAAVALAEYNSDTVEKFVEKMNNKAKQLGLIATKYINPTGLNQTAANSNQDATFSNQNKTTEQNNNQETVKTSPDINNLQQTIGIIKAPQNKETQNISTAYDLTLLAKYAYGKSFVRRAAVKKDMAISSTDGITIHKLKNTNELLNSYLKVLGLKTGTTDEAGECLIAIIENDQGHDILTVVLNSPSRYAETKLLADWVFKAYKWE